MQGKANSRVNNRYSPKVEDYALLSESLGDEVKDIVERANAYAEKAARSSLTLTTADDSREDYLLDLVEREEGIIAGRKS